MNKIASAFSEIAAKYDQQRRFLIPCFDDFYKLLVELAESTNPNPKILDIGAGTGLLTDFMLQKFSKAEYTLIDFSDEMLNVAQQRFQHIDQINYVIADYKDYVNHEQFDIIVSSLSIHHLTDVEKRNLYKGIFDSLKGEEHSSMGTSSLPEIRILKSGTVNYGLTK